VGLSPGGILNSQGLNFSVPALHTSFVRKDSGSRVLDKGCGVLKLPWLPWLCHSCVA